MYMDMLDMLELGMTMELLLNIITIIDVGHGTYVLQTYHYTNYIVHCIFIIKRNI